MAGRPTAGARVRPGAEHGPVKVHGGAPSVVDVTSAVAVSDAAVSVGGRTVWRDLNVDIGQGEFVAVLGPNGVGKSTLIKAILGLVPLSAGRMRVLGQPPGEANARIGYLPQRRSFDPALRVRG